MMSGDLNISQLNSETVEQAVALVRETFNPVYLSASIYRSVNISAFIQKELQNSWSPYEYKVVQNQAGRVVGYCEFKKTDDVIFLNMIATSPIVKGKGIAKHLLDSSIRSFKDDGYSSMMLDVFSSNALALNWYQRKGFAGISKRFLFRDGGNDWQQRGNIRILNYPQLTTLQQQFGFSMADYSIDGEQRKAGIIRNDLILHNCTSFKEVIDAGFLRNILGLENTFILAATSDLAGAELLDSIERLKLTF